MERKDCVKCFEEFLNSFNYMYIISVIPLFFRLQKTISSQMLCKTFSFISARTSQIRYDQDLLGHVTLIPPPSAK